MSNPGEFTLDGKTFDSFRCGTPGVWMRSMEECPIPGMRVFEYEGKPLFKFLPDLFGRPYFVAQHHDARPWWISPEKWALDNPDAWGYSYTFQGIDNSAGCYLTYFILALACAVSAVRLSGRKEKDKNETEDKSVEDSYKTLELGLEAWMYSCIFLCLHSLMLAYEHYYAFLHVSMQPWGRYPYYGDVSYLLSTTALGCRFCIYLLKQTDDVEKYKWRRNTVVLLFFVIGVGCLLAYEYLLFVDLEWLTVDYLSAQHDLNHLFFLFDILWNFGYCRDRWVSIISTGILLGMVGTAISKGFEMSCNTPCPVDRWVSPKFNHDAIGNTSRAVSELMITMALMMATRVEVERPSARTTTSSTASNDSSVTKSLRSRGSQRRSFQ